MSTVEHARARTPTRRWAGLGAAAVVWFVLYAVNGRFWDWLLVDAFGLDPESRLGSTHENGGVWTMRPPKIEGSSDVYAASVLGGKPANYWRLGELAGDSDAVNEVKGDLASYNEFVTLGAAGPFADKTAASFNGTTSEVVDQVPSLDTTSNFSVSAWVRLTDNTRHQRAVAIAGTRVPGMWLGYNKDVNKWQFTMYQSDTDAAASNRAGSTAVAALNTWTQLTGTYDATSRALKLYVNGVLQETVTVGGTKWKAGGSLSVGRGFWTGAPADYWKGELADVATFGAVLSPEQVAAQFAAARQAAPVAITKVASGVASIVMPVATMAVTDPGGNEHLLLLRSDQRVPGRGSDRRAGQHHQVRLRRRRLQQPRPTIRWAC